MTQQMRWMRRNNGVLILSGISKRFTRKPLLNQMLNRLRLKWWSIQYPFLGEFL